MRLVSPKDELASKLGTAARVASAKSTIQILSHVLLRAEDGRCELAATDMELSLRVPLEATAEEPGAVVLPRLAGDIVRSMADGPVTLDAHGLNSWFGSAFVMLTGLGLFEVTRRHFVRQWGEIQEFIEKEIKRREAL